MPYVELKKLHYIDSEKYAKEYLNRFASEEAVKLDFYIKEKQAFFLLNAEVMSLAYKIARIDKRIGELYDNLPGIAINQYSKKCLIDEIVITNRIEGVHSSRKEIGDAKKYLFGMIQITQKAVGINPAAFFAPCILAKRIAFICRII